MAEATECQSRVAHQISNPCPCGFYGDNMRECRCTPGIIQRYLAKISGPLLDRIDMHIEVPAVPYKELRSKGDGHSSAHIRERVEAARDTQRQRGFYNSQIPPSLLRSLCALDESGERTLEMAVRRMNLSARAHDRMLRVARTVADLDHSPNVAAKHLAEAAQCRIGITGADAKPNTGVRTIRVKTSLISPSLVGSCFRHYK